MTKRVREAKNAATAAQKEGTGEREGHMGEVDRSGRGLQWRGVEDGVDVKGVGRGCGADKAKNPLIKRAGGGCDRDVGGGREIQTLGGREATHGAG
jgi:hypothetical protein